MWDDDLWCECNAWDIEWGVFDGREKRCRRKFSGQDEPISYDAWVQLTEDLVEEDLDEEKEELSPQSDDFAFAEYEQYKESISRGDSNRDWFGDDESDIPDDVDFTTHETCLHPPDRLLDFWNDHYGFRAAYKRRGAPPFDSRTSVVEENLRAVCGCPHITLIAPFRWQIGMLINASSLSSPSARRSSVYTKNRSLRPRHGGEL